jgi:hypothetical protein
VIGRAKFEAILQRTNTSRERSLVEVRRLAEVIEPLPQPVCRDPDDDEVLALATAAKADLVVSGDNDLLSLKSFPGHPDRRAGRGCPPDRGNGRNLTQVARRSAFDRPESVSISVWRHVSGSASMSPSQRFIAWLPHLVISMVLEPPEQGCQGRMSL